MIYSSIPILVIYSLTTLDSINVLQRVCIVYTYTLLYSIYLFIQNPVFFSYYILDTISRSIVLYTFKW